MLSMVMLMLACGNDEKSEDTEPTQEELDDLQAEACHADIENWPEEWKPFEERVVDLVNQRRAQGADCGQYGTFEATEPVVMEPNLRCSARYHSKWMGENEVYDHASPGGGMGEDPWERMESTDFAGFAIGENVAFGYPSPDQVVDGWMSSDGHCSNIMNPDANVLGVGYAFVESSSYGYMWTQNFGFLE